MNVNQFVLEFCGSAKLTPGRLDQVKIVIQKLQYEFITFIYIMACSKREFYLLQ